MQPRYHLTTRRKDSFIESLDRESLEEFRRNLPSIFKGKHIKHVIRIEPDTVPLRELVDYR